MCFPVNLAKLRRTPFSRNPADDCFCTSQQLSSSPLLIKSETRLRINKLASKIFYTKYKFQINHIIFQNNDIIKFVNVSWWFSQQ